MNVVRKSIGALIIIFVAIPVLIGIIWAVGVTKAAVSPEFLSDLPREVIEKVPNMIDDIVDEIDREDMVMDADGREWVWAIAKAETSPKELLGKVGILHWLENEVSRSLREMGEMLRGERPFRTIVLDMRPLKKPSSMKPSPNTSWKFSNTSPNAATPKYRNGWKSLTTNGTSIIYPLAAPPISRAPLWPSVITSSTKSTKSPMKSTSPKWTTVSPSLKTLISPRPSYL